MGFGSSCIILIPEFPFHIADRKFYISQFFFFHGPAASRFFRRPFHEKQDNLPDAGKKARVTGRFRKESPVQASRISSRHPGKRQAKKNRAYILKTIFYFCTLSGGRRKPAAQAVSFGRFVRIKLREAIVVGNPNNSDLHKKLRPYRFLCWVAAGALSRLASRNASHFGATSCRAHQFAI
jgi:hypothetical protein